jgi:hypothetical protein
MEVSDAVENQQKSLANMVVPFKNPVGCVKFGRKQKHFYWILGTNNPHFKSENVINMTAKCRGGYDENTN